MKWNGLPHKAVIPAQRAAVHAAVCGGGILCGSLFLRDKAGERYPVVGINPVNLSEYMWCKS